MINYIKNILNRQWSRTIFRYLLYQIFFRPEAIPSIITVVDYMTSLNLVPSGNFPRVFFPSGNFPNVLFSKRQLPKSALAAALSPQPVIPLTHPSRIARPPLQPGLTFRKLPLGKLHIWEVATWEFAFGKVPNTNIYASFSSNVSQPRSRLLPKPN